MATKPLTVPSKEELKAKEKSTKKAPPPVPSSLSKYMDYFPETEVVPDYLSLGCPELDFIIGGSFTNGGVPAGRTTEIYGNESTGKSTLAYNILASAQRKGGKAILIDTEGAANRVWLSVAGVDVDELLVADKVYTVEEVFKLIREVIALSTKEKWGTTAIVLDSLAATQSQAERDKDFGEKVIAGQARAMSEGLKKVTVELAQSNVALVITNQLRDNVGVMYGPTEVTVGGRSLRFYCTVRIAMGKKELRKSDGVLVAKVRCVKNKLHEPFGEAMVVMRTAVRKELKRCGIDLLETTLVNLKHFKIVSVVSGKYKLTVPGTDEPLSFMGRGFHTIFDEHKDYIFELLADKNFTPLSSY